MKVSIMQPNIFMWNGLVKQLHDSDIHIVLDHVKASKNARYNRNKIAGNGSVSWLTIPMVGFSRNKKIKELGLNLDETQLRKIKRTIEERYERSPFFDNLQDTLDMTLKGSSSKNTNLISVYLKFLDALRRMNIIECNIILSSSLIEENKEIADNHGVNLVNKLLEEVNAETYLAAENTAQYASVEDYTVKKVKIQHFSYKEYSQKQSGLEERNFVKNLSCLDTIAFLNRENFIEYLEKSNTWKEL